MIVRYTEICPRCGQFDPWRKYSTRVIRGERRTYVKCRRCGAREVVVYRLLPANLPQRGNNNRPAA